jgi:hypothetical protein
MPTSVKAPLTAPAPGANGHAEQRAHEDQADQGAPETAAQGAGGGKFVHLMQLHLALVVLDGDHCIFEIDEVFLLHLAQHGADFLGFELVFVGDDYQVAHQEFSCAAVGLR